MTKNRNTQTLKAFGRRLKWLRKQKGFTQLELEEAADISESVVGRLERGISNPTLTTLIAIAKALKIDVRDLFDK